ncbi:MAG: MBL fold metallo-hydrolase [Rivularia sp. (in: Bacteria)]|nr:MBL fold metallo-hydrolase [Rivularia sp. MS3]
MLFRQLFDKESSTYTYLIADEEAKAAVLVDPVIENVERDLQLIHELDLTLKYCLETHIHADHITGTGKLREITGCLSIVPKNAGADCTNMYITDAEVLHFGSIIIEAIATPGHTDSHITYLVNNDRVLTGDALLIRGCGRTDFQSGDAGTLFDSVTQRLFTLPKNTLVYPAHDYQGKTVSTIGEEKKWNPRFVEWDSDSRKLRSRADFIKLMSNLDLSQPKKMMEAIPANEHCGKSVEKSNLK